jgi:hypothetical protein
MSIATRHAEKYNSVQRELAQRVLAFRKGKSRLRKLRALGTPTWVDTPWFRQGITFTWIAEVADIKATATRFIEKFSLLVPLEEITCVDSNDGVREIKATFSLPKEDNLPELHYTLTARLSPLSDERATQARCRRVVVGEETHTSVRPKYAIICDEENA